MITRKAIIEAWVSIRRLNDTIPDEVIDFLRDAAIEKHEQLLKPTTVEDMENSGHSFTEGMHYPHQTATIDEQIEFMETVKRTMVVPFKFESEIGAVINTLRTNKVFEHQRMLIQNINFEKVISDLVAVVKTIKTVPDSAADYCIQNAEAALGMIDAFKKKSSPPEWVKNFAQVKSVSWADYPKEMQKKQEDYRDNMAIGPITPLTKEIIYQRVARMLHNTNEYGEAKAIIYAIEQMAKLNPIGTV